jgi:hypothetical protein
MPVIDQNPAPPKPPPPRRTAAVFGSDSAHGFAHHSIRVVFSDRDGRWVERPGVLAYGPQGGIYTAIQVSDHELEKFALDILRALHDKRAVS